MKYRISIKNASRNNTRELMYEIYTSRKKAQEIADKINMIQAEREAIVIKK